VVVEVGGCGSVDEALGQAVVVVPGVGGCGAGGGEVTVTVIVVGSGAGGFEGMGVGVGAGVGGCVVGEGADGVAYYFLDEC
jgi:hypothetical protein